MIFLVKDGPRGNATSEGCSKQIQEITNRIGNRVCKFLGTATPAFNVASPSDDYRRVVVEVGTADNLNNKFQQIGFYIIDDLDASQAEFLLKNVDDNGNE
ncbi:hypothetical protein H7U20_01070 [Rugamonas sp. CCM 8940]|nr:hypothetical protein [Rugamonas sp. CCM 8940]MBJ7308787.1 hypothetical protein [Rugamonas sp. CCM 8940]